MSEENIKYSVVIPAYGQAELMPRLLDSLAQQTVAHLMEVIVVNDCSPDNTEEVVLEWMAQPGLKCATQYHCMPENGGPGKARNAGLRLAKGHLVCFTDTDCVAEVTWVEELVKKIDEKKNIIGSGGRVEPLAINTIFALYYHFNRTLEPVIFWRGPYLITCNCCYVRDVLLEVGGYDETIPFPGGEDLAASIFLHKKGYKFAYAPGSVIFHDYRDDFKKFRKTWYCYGYGTSWVTHRYLEPAEIYPELRLDFKGDHFWPAHCTRPSITGLRSYLSDFKVFYNDLVEREASLWTKLRCMLIRPVDRHSYYQGWEDALRDLAKATDKQPSDYGAPIRGVAPHDHPLRKEQERNA